VTLETTTVSGQRLGKHEYEYVGSNRFTVGNGEFLRGPCRDVISKGQSQLSGSSAQKSVKTEPGRVKLKNLHC
jgi:hypothetical protein